MAKAIKRGKKKKAVAAKKRAVKKPRTKTAKLPNKAAKPSKRIAPKPAQRLAPPRVRTKRQLRPSLSPAQQRQARPRKVSAYDELPRTPANFQPLTPLTLLERAAGVFPDRIAVIHGS